MLVYRITACTWMFTVWAPQPTSKLLKTPEGQPMSTSMRARAILQLGAVLVGCSCAVGDCCQA